MIKPRDVNFRKLSVFFVISLMLVVGLFINDAAPQGRIYSDLISIYFNPLDSPEATDIIPIDDITAGQYQLRVAYTSHNDDDKAGFRVDIPDGIVLDRSSLRVRIRAFTAGDSRLAGAPLMFLPDTNAPDSVAFNAFTDSQKFGARRRSDGFYYFDSDPIPHHPRFKQSGTAEYALTGGESPFTDQTSIDQTGGRFLTLHDTDGEGTFSDKGIFLNGNEIIIRHSAGDFEDKTQPNRSAQEKTDRPIVQVTYLIWCDVTIPASESDVTYTFEYEVNTPASGASADAWRPLNRESIDVTASGKLPAAYHTGGAKEIDVTMDVPQNEFPDTKITVFVPNNKAPVYGSHGFGPVLEPRESADSYITRSRVGDPDADTLSIKVRGGASVQVGWGFRETADEEPPDITVATDSTLPLAAGSYWNVLKFTYRPTADNLSDGRFRIAFPSDWEVSNKFLSVMEEGDDGPVTIYETNGEGAVSADSDTDRVDFEADKRITVALDSAWGPQRFNRDLIIQLGDVTAPIPSRLDEAATDDYAAHAEYEFLCSESTRNDVLSLLPSPPVVRVGNIKGGTDRDPLKRKLTIEPGRVFSGEENTEFTLTFTAPGPMHNSSLELLFGPEGADMAHLGPQDTPVKADFNVEPRGGATLDDTTDPTPWTVDEGTATAPAKLTIPIAKLDTGQQIIVSYTRAAAIGSSADADITAWTTVRRYAVKVSTGTYASVEVSGGVWVAKAGSGKLDLSPASVEAGSQRRDIDLTYEAYTDLEDATITIEPKGIVLDDDQKLQTDTSTDYGYVSGSEGLVVNDGDTLEWSGLDLEKGKTVTAKIRRVNILAEADEYEWGVMVNDTKLANDETTDIDDRPILSVVKTSGDAVRFEVDGDDTFRAGSKATINFKFIADSTPIRDGEVRLTIPSTLGFSPPTKADATAGEVAVSGEALKSGGAGGIGADQITLSGRTITVAIGRLDVDESVTITYGAADDSKAVLHHAAGAVEVAGTFRTSRGASTRTAGTATVTLSNVEDGMGAAVLSPGTIEAGSSNRAIEVVFTAAGTMDGGAVSLEIPDGWGSMQNDPTQRNYVTTRGAGVSAVEIADRYAIATIDTLAKGGSFRFIYGGGTGAAVGAEVQDNVGTAQFVIRSDGDGDGVFEAIESDLEHTGREKIRNPDKTQKIYKDAAGILQVKVTSALDGTGTVTLDTSSVRAASDDVVLVFTYKPSQTIEDGELKFTVPSSWSQPQVEEVSLPGYTEVEGVGLGSVADDDKFSVTVPIFSLDKANDIKITYGATDAGRAVASATTGVDAFRFAVRGGESGNLAPIRTQPTVTVNPQASGKGKAVIAITDGEGSLHTGDTGRELTVTYTAAGQMVGGKVRLAVPAGWSAPTADTVTITPAIAPTFSGQMAIVEGVNLSANGTVTFVYTGDVQPNVGTGVAFAVGVHGGDAADDFDDVSGDETMLTVDVDEARRGAGSGEVAPRIVDAGATGVNLTFTYTAVGLVNAPREFRVQVPPGWTAPSSAPMDPENKGTYTVAHRHMGVTTTVSVEKLTPVGRDMVARVKLGGLEVEAGDEIIFTYQNADAPANREVSEFVMLFDGQRVNSNVSVRVQDSTPTQLTLSSAGTVSADDGAMPLGITVGLRDAEGHEVAMVSDVSVTLTSSSAGTFSELAEGTGTESITVTVAGGEVSAMVYYQDSTPGIATITATAPGLTMASQPVTVTTSVIAITEGSVTIEPALAMAGDTVTVSAMGTAGRTVMFSVGSIVTDHSMAEVSSGAYSGSFTVVADQHPDGMYDVSVSLNGQSVMVSNALTLDSTMPTVMAMASPETIANGEPVEISATVSDASSITSVMADVSTLDTTQTDGVALTMGTDGAYSASVVVSEDNTAINGSKTITVTAIDAAGNSGSGTAMVTLDNQLSYTSQIPAGTSLFHVPLAVEGLNTVGDLREMLGSDANLLIVYDSATDLWNSRSDDVPITADLGILLSMSAEATVTFTGYAWDDGASTINLTAGSNLIGLPVNDARLTNVSDIAALFATGVVTSVVVSTADGYKSVTAAGDVNDGPVMGDAAYLVTATTDATAALIGTGWSQDTAAAAPIALVNHQVAGQTPVLEVNGSVVDETNGVAQDGFRVKVKNLSTKAALNRVTSAEAATGYNMTFVDLKVGHAAQVGDVLEISADSPSPLIGVQPVRHIVTIDDVKATRIELADLIAYEIPSETELLRNYPNPFNPETWIPYRLASDAEVVLTIYDSTGLVVRTLDMGHQMAAVYESRAKAIYWDGRNRFGEQVASGIYFYSLSAGDFSATRKMMILK